MTAEELARALGGKRSGRQWSACCPAHEDRSPSLIIFDGRESVQVRCLVGCATLDVIDALRRRGLWDGGDRIGKSQSAAQCQGLTVSRETSARVSRDDHSGMARSIFDDSREIEGTLAEQYLRSRHLWSDRVRGIADVRYHARCPRGAERVPAVVIAMRAMNSATRLRAIQRVFLRADGAKDGAQMLGAVGGSAMMLTPHHEAFAGPLSWCEELTVCEGFETGLAALLLGYKVVWALGSAGAMRSLPVLFGVGSLTIAADHDRLVMMAGRWVRPGIEAAEVCRKRWCDAGRRCWIDLSNIEGHDLADAWSAKHGR